MNVINNDGSYPAEPILFQYKETRSNDFLLSPQDYFMSIVRFNLQTPSLPVFIPQINVNPNSNYGGTYPICGMSNTANTHGNFSVFLYTNNTLPVGSIVYLGYNAYNPTVAPAAGGDTSATGLQYFRVIAINPNSPFSTSQTEVQLNNASGTTTGAPNNYPNSTGLPPSYPLPFGNGTGATQSLTIGKFNLTQINLSGTLAYLTVSPTIGTLANLTDVFQVGDTINVTNTNSFNGSYVITAITNGTSTFTCKPSFTIPTNFQTYVSGGFVLGKGDFIDVTPYTITMDYNQGGNVILQTTQPVLFQTTNLGNIPPIWNASELQSLTLAQLTTEYFQIYNYPNWISMVNNCLTGTFWTLQGIYYNGNGTSPTPGSQLPNSGVNPSQFQAPSMSWDANDLKGIITASYKLFAQNTESIGTKIAKIYFNDPFSTLFDSFPYIYPNVNVNDPRYSLLVLNTNSGAGTFIVQAYNDSGTPGLAYLGIQAYQDHQTASLMNPIQSIVFTSTLLPVVMENVGVPIIVNGTSTTQVVLGSSANVFPVVTDFVVPFSAVNNYLPDVTYVPSGEYRLVDLYGSSPCKQIDIQVFWKDVYGQQHPFYLSSGCSGSLKVMFRAKNYNSIALD